MSARRAMTKFERAVFDRFVAEGVGLNEARQMARQEWCKIRAEEATTVEQLRSVVLDMLDKANW